MKKNLHSSIFLGCLLSLLSMLTNFQALALEVTANEKYSKLHVLSTQDSVAPGDSFWLMFHMELLPGWHTYWQNPGDSGLPTKIEVTTPKGWQADKLIFLPPEIIQISELEVVDYGYKDNAYLLMKLTSSRHAKAGTAKIKIDGQWVTCLDRCVPQSADLELEMVVGSSSLAIEKPMIDQKLDAFMAIRDVTAHAQIKDNTIAITIPVTSTTDLDEPFLFVEQKDVIQNKAKQKWLKNTEGVEFDLPRGSMNASDLSGYVRLNSTEHVRFAAKDLTLTESSHSKLPISFLSALGLAFLGGLLLNIMPCVFPILTLKIVSLTKMRQADPAHRIEHGLAYTAGIVVTFTALAVLIVLLQAAGHHLGWGFQMQSPYFLAAMTYVLFLVACNLFGWIEFIIPIPVQSQGPVKYSLGSSFYAGLLVTIIATPCTAPFMAPAVGYALSQPLLIIMTIFTMMGLGLAFPFLLVTLIPPLAALIPKPGRWLLTFKQALAFPMLLTTVWLLWLLIKATHANFVALVLVGLIAIGFYIWLRDTLKLNRAQKALWFIVMAIVVGFPFYGPIQSPREPSEPLFTQERLNSVLSNHEKVLVNVTADWCITCKVNESLVLSDSKVQAYFKDHDIYFFTVDWSHPNPEVTDYLHQFNRSGVPLYVFYVKGREPVVLPQVLTFEVIKEYLGRDPRSDAAR